MYNIKRIGTIYSKGMTKEIEETILNDGKQMNTLYENIDNYKKLLSEKDDEINLLKEQNKIYKEIIEKNNIKINSQLKTNSNFSSECKMVNSEYKNIKEINTKIYMNEVDKLNNKIPIEETDEYQKLKLKLIDMSTKYNNLLDNFNNFSIKENFSEKEDNIKEKLKKVILEDFKQEMNDKDILLNNLQEEINSLKSEKQTKSSTLKSCKSPDTRDISEIEKITRCPISIYKECDTELKRFIAAENAFRIKYQYDIEERYFKNIDNISIDEILEFKINQENISYQDKSRLKYKIKRCHFLHETYNDKLNFIHFPLSNIERMSGSNWKKWLLRLDELILQVDKLYPEIDQGVPCEYIWKRGENKDKKCGIIKCKKHKFIL